MVVDFGVRGREPESGVHVGRAGPKGSVVVAAGPDVEGKEERVAEECLGSLTGPSLIVDHNIPGLWSLGPTDTRAGNMSRADIFGDVGVNVHSRRGHFRPSTCKDSTNSSSRSRKTRQAGVETKTNALKCDRNTSTPFPFLGALSKTSTNS